MSYDVLIAWLIGCAVGFCVGVHHCWALFVGRNDPIGDGIRKQMRKVRSQKRFVDADWQVSSFATVNTVDGEFQVIVRQPATSEPTS